MTVAQRKRVHRQMRGFVLIWTLVTFLMVMATFLAIYFTYRPDNPDADNGLNVAIPLGETPATQPAQAEGATAPINPSPTSAPAVAQNSVPTPTPGDVLSAQPTPTRAVTATGLPPTPLPVNDTRFQVGIQVQYSLDLNPDNQDGYYRSVAQDLGLNWVKQQVRWEDVEPQKGVYDWSKLDLAMPSAQRFGLKVMLSIVTAPAWAREPGADLSQHGPPANTQDYVDFVLAILNRYPAQVHAIEVWNEMNLDREWTSTQGLSAANYVALLRDTYNAVKAVDPGIIIITGALSPTGVDDGVRVINDFRYTEMLINAGALDVADCYGAHHNGINVGPSYRYDAVPPDPSAQFRGPFDNPHHSWSFRSTLEGYATRIRNAGYNTPLCVTEFGWAVAEDLEGVPAGFEFAYDNTLEEQAQYLTEAMTLMDQWGFVWLAFVWNFNYAPQAGWSVDNDNVAYSLIGPGFTFRPAYDAIRDWQSARTSSP